MSKNDDYVKCADNKECDCLEVTAGSILPLRNDGATNPYKSVAVSGMSDYKTCAKEYTAPGYDRFINITGITSGRSYQISGKVQDINEGHECEGDVTIGIYLPPVASSSTPAPEITLQESVTLQNIGPIAGSYFVIALQNRDTAEDCLVSISVSEVTS